MNALTWITKEARRLRRKYPRRFEKWTDYVAQASAIYAKKHKGKSPVGKKHAHHVRRKTATAKKRRRISGVSTKSKTHTDKNRITANIQVGKIGSASTGTLKSEIKKRYKEKIDKAVIRRYHATTIRARKKATRAIRTATALYNRV